MDVKVPDLEQRLVNLQWQVERLAQVAEGNVQSIEGRLAGMADQYAETLKRWAVTAERHSRTVTQLESYVAEWKDANSRLQLDTFQRIRELESVIQHEWETLKKSHSQPIKELRDQAAALTEACMATASAAQQGIERAEGRLAAFEDDVHLILSEFGRDLQRVIADIKTLPRPQPAGLDRGASWSLDDVTRLHSQLRDAGDVVQTVEPGSSVDRPAQPAPRALPTSTAGVSEPQPVQSDLPPESTNGGRIISERESRVEPPLAWKWRVAMAGLGLMIVVSGAFGWYLQNQVRTAAGRAQAAELQMQRAAADAAREATAAREEAAREISSAREMANRAGLIGNVLAAPDLIRYSLSGGAGAPPASGQALWSRTRGFVFSGSRVPMPPQNGVHQVWLLTRLSPLKAATFVPEPDGTVTLVVQGLNVPRAVVGVMVTAESAGGSDSPTGEPILTSALPVP